MHRQRKKSGSENRSLLSHNCHFYFKAWPAVVRTRQEGKVSHILVFNFTASAGVESNLTLRMRLMVSPKNVWDRISPFAANKKIHFVWEKEEATTFTGLLRQLQLLVIDALKIYSRSCLIFSVKQPVKESRSVAPFPHSSFCCFISGKTCQKIYYKPSNAVLAHLLSLHVRR